MKSIEKRTFRPRLWLSDRVHAPQSRGYGFQSLQELVLISLLFHSLSIPTSGVTFEEL